ncbi:bifunctional riboflavin kinase/FAD synthetase [Verrucomicrobiales bacterium]|nr:bifunctional riboflavin kinase/FAD synthetase [Verrucomicrobiales bacterium]
MKRFSDISNLAEINGPVHLAIGVFDGVHLGHQKVIARALDGANRDRGNAVVITFDPHPGEVLRPGGAPARLTPLPIQESVLERLGVDFLLAVPFTPKFSEVGAADFVHQLAAACNPLRRICIGYDWRFGKGREGDVHLLADLGREYGFEVTALPAVEAGDIEVRSTRIREAISEGNLELANTLLGRFHILSGTVVEGKHLGRSIGFPTANLELSTPVVPPFGVYAVDVRCGDREFIGVANYGRRPTVEDGEPQAIFEVHIIGDEPGDLYGKTLEVGLRRFLRSEKKFSSLEELKAQIGADVSQAVR